MSTQHGDGYDAQVSSREGDVYPFRTTLSGTADAVHEVRPINWITLSADEAEAEWLNLNAWVNWLRRTYGLPPTIVPPFWHRHDELVWELSALHTHWLNCYDPDASPSAPLGWHRDFAEARNRLREWVATCGTRLDRDRPTRQTTWPGETPGDPKPQTFLANRDEDFVTLLISDVNSRTPRSTDSGDGGSHRSIWESDASTDPDGAPPYTLRPNTARRSDQPA
jgi:hypothetical protein